MKSPLVALILAASLVLLIAGCFDDEDCPDCPDVPAAPAPSMANIWPHADGAGWLYDLVFTEYARLGEPLHAATKDLAGIRPPYFLSAYAFAAEDSG